MVTKDFPIIFLKRLEQILPQDDFSAVVQNFSSPRRNVLRVNTIKTTPEQVYGRLRDSGVKFSPVPEVPGAIIMEEPREVPGLREQGWVYEQNLSSQLPALVLDPKPDERILDLCAAPGSKTTQIAALMNNRGEIVAVEPVRDRFYRLKSVIQLLGAQNVRLKMTDGRRLRDPFLFDRVLVDAPCSSEGRFHTDDPKTFAYWSPRKIKEMVRKQRGLLLTAGRLLKTAGVMVYSTCTFAPEENEGVVDWFLRKTDGAFSVENIDWPGIHRYPPVSEWEGRVFNPQVQKCLRVLPTEMWEGFFVVKFIKRRETKDMRRTPK